VFTCGKKAENAFKASLNLKVLKDYRRLIFTDLHWKTFYHMAYFARFACMKRFFRCGLGEEKKEPIVTNVNHVVRARGRGTSLPPKTFANLLRLFIHGFMDGLTAGIDEKNEVVSKAFDGFEGTARWIRRDSSYHQMATIVCNISKHAQDFILIRKEK
jgi:hypothetical protein